MTYDPSPARRRPRATALALAAVLGGLLLFGCASAAPDQASSGSAGADGAASESGGKAGLNTQLDAGGATPASVPNQVPPGEPLDDRSVISTASLRVRVQDRRVAADKVRTIVTDAKGIVFSSQADLVGHDDTTLTLKVPPARFEPVLAALAELGTPLERHTNVEDVTDQVVDFQGRLESAEASAARLRTLLDQASDVQGIVAIEGELSTREAEVESLQGRLRVITTQVDLATIDVSLTERGEPVVSNDIPGFAQGLRHGWIALRNTLAAIVTVIGFLLPFLVILLPFALVLRWWLKRRFPAAAVATTPAPRPPGPMPGPQSP